MQKGLMFLYAIRGKQGVFETTVAQGIANTEIN